MASERDLELLDDYIGNRLNKSEKELFEAKLQSDRDLQREFTLQQGIVDSLKKTRAAELKALLSNIPTSAIPGETSSLTRWSAGAVAIVVAIGLYFYLKPQEPIVTESAPDTVSTIAPDIRDNKTEVAPQKTDPKESTTPEVKTIPSGTVKSVEKQSVTKPAAEVKTPKIEVFDPNAEGSSDTAEGAVNAQSGNSHAFVSDIKSEIVTDNKAYTFHYQFKDDRLILYGGFDKNLYQILEFIADNKRTIFLSYKNNFYLLNQAGEKVRPLSPVNDPVLIQKLKEYQSQ